MKARPGNRAFDYSIHASYMTTLPHTLPFRMTSIRLIRSLAVCSLMLALHPIAAAPASPEKTGVAVGQKAPGFTLKDQNDREVSLAALLKKGPVALVFFRSADW